MFVSSTATLPGLRPGVHPPDLLIRYGVDGDARSVPIRALTSPDAESWHLEGATVGERGGWKIATSTDYALVQGAFDGEDVTRVTRDAYLSLLELVESLERPNLIRIWNYVRDVNAPEDGLERYQRFSVGRFEALASAGFKLSSDLPAASAVGTHYGPQLTVVALASVHPGTQVENPRQVSAWAYPPRYGPRSPSFSRATIETGGTQRRLWISGTASIVGHESTHPGDPAAQLDETMQNIEAVIGAAGMEGGLERVGMLKVYVRHAEHFPLLQSLLTARLPNAPVLWVEADICRQELLLEIEGYAIDSR